MFPLKDDAPRATTPYVNFTLIALNVLIFLYEFWIWSQSPSDLNAFVDRFGMVPVHFTDAFFSVNYVPFTAAILPIFTSMFLHGSPFHLIFNMWALWIFGDNIEDCLGHGMYAVFYMVCGVSATLLHIAAIPIRWCRRSALAAPLRA